MNFHQTVQYHIQEHSIYINCHVNLKSQFWWCSQNLLVHKYDILDVTSIKQVRVAQIYWFKDILNP
jgi:hypothetical protein